MNFYPIAHDVTYTLKNCEKDGLDAAAIQLEVRRYQPSDHLGYEYHPGLIRTCAICFAAIEYSYQYWDRHYYAIHACYTCHGLIQWGERP